MMRRALPGLPRLSAAFTLAALLAIVAGCGLGGSRELQPGSYRAVLELPSGELPFGLDVAKEETGFVLYLVNGEERVRIPEVKAEPGKFSAAIPGYENTIEGRISRRSLEGEVRFVRKGGEIVSLPFKAKYGETWRFFKDAKTDNVEVQGRWAVTFTSDSGKTSSGLAELEQTFEKVTGTILTPGGDHRFLAGEVRGDELYLSRFDGASAYLYRAQVNERGELVGEQWSGKTGHQRWTAQRNADAVLDTSSVATSLKDPAAKLEFSFPDLDGKTVSLSDPQFQGKVVIITVAGSWCPNCHDEAAFLTELHEKYRDQGLEIISLHFEYFGDFAQAAAATRRFRDKFGIEYTTLIAGTTDADDVARALPQLTGIHAYPTTLFLDRTGQVRKIHAGFAGPATGQHYERLVNEYTSLVATLLAENAPDR
jgi:thiol-disulfide isomerase/thioredoxin